MSVGKARRTYPMKKITELNREILTLVENLRAGIVSVEKAEPLIKSAEMIV